MIVIHSVVILQNNIKDDVQKFLIYTVINKSANVTPSHRDLEKCLSLILLLRNPFVLIASGLCYQILSN